MLEKRSSDRGSNRLAERRRQSRRRGWIAFGVILAILLGALLWILQQGAVRISKVQVFGGDESLSLYATSAMQGNYFGIIPRDSIVFFPEDSIRSNIVAAHPEIAAVSLFRKGMDGLTIKIDNRTPVARWCGLSPTEGVEAYCYFFDVKGYIFATAATTTPTLNSFVVYAPLVNDTLEPLRATLVHAADLPSVFDFARQLSTFGSSVSSIVFIADEVSLHLVSGTRIAYVVGNEQNAFTALVSAKANLNLADGSIEYVDLRFDGKVYVKRKQ